MSRDNWERLVAAVLKRQQIWELCHQQSRSPSISTVSSDEITTDFCELILNSNRRKTGTDSGSGESSSSSRPAAKQKARLDRRNAVKNIDYEYSPSSATASSSSSHYSSEESLRTRPLDMHGSRTSFRIDSIGGDIEIICKNLGFSGIDDLSIPPEEYEAMKTRNYSAPVVFSQTIEEVNYGNVVELSGDGGGIKGVRPPVLALPPLMSLPVMDKECSTWDMFRALGPDSDTSISRFEGHFCLDEDEEGGWKRNGDEEDRRRKGMAREENCVRSGSCSFTPTSNDDDSSSTTTDPMSSNSPNGRFRRVISEWQKGELLDHGSFGSVYEGIADDGFFFAVKEVSLLDQGDEGKQRIIQLEQEIALLSQFKHENIVRYYGTKKDESHLYIFLEFVSIGSLLSLYQKYTLKDSVVSAYTRQILHGLKYLHDRNVVHRDIKCANILVDTNGSVKLTDFGLAKVTKFNDVKSCKGTAFWMAPEVVRSLGYGLAADIWSLGCTVLEMLTRRFPYADLEFLPALFRIGNGERPPIPDSLSSDARDFILRCLQVDPSLRPTAAQLLDHPFVKRPLLSSSGFASPHNFAREF